MSKMKKIVDISAIFKGTAALTVAAAACVFAMLFHCCKRLLLG